MANNLFGKVRAFNVDYFRGSHLDYDVIGRLDADIAFDENTFLFLGRLAEDHALGLVGTPFKEWANFTYD
jgi:hypothetical protein